MTGNTATTKTYEEIRAAHAAAPIAATMMDRPLRTTDILRRSEKVFADQQVISRTGPGTTSRMSYAALGLKARRIGALLVSLGVRPGQRVATMMWNHGHHLACYYGTNAAGAVLHTLNPRLTAEELAYVIADAGDDVVILDAEFLPLWKDVAAHVSPRHVIVNGGDGTLPELDDMLADQEPIDWPDDAFDETSAAAICYTSGTTGRPKGVVYSHCSICLHALASSAPDSFGISCHSTTFTLTPMFHVNAWGTPFSAIMAGATMVLPGAHAKADEMLDLMQSEAVTTAFGVPTIWTDVLHALQAEPDRWHLNRDLLFCVGGAAPPPEMFRAFERFGIRMQTGWGMTETSPIASQTFRPPHFETLSEEERTQALTANGPPLPFIEFRIVDEAGTALPWDEKARGELQVRGPWVTASYIGHPAPIVATTADGWMLTGDIAVISQDGNMRLVDRLKSLIKSGGEWISSTEMENRISDLPEVAEVAVIAIKDDRWGEAPLPVIRPREGLTVDHASLTEHLRPHFPKWALPERIELLDELPRTGTGKLNKMLLRERYDRN